MFQIKYHILKKFCVVNNCYIFLPNAAQVYHLRKFTEWFYLFKLTFFFFFNSSGCIKKVVAEM